MQIVIFTVILYILQTMKLKLINFPKDTWYLNTGLSDTMNFGLNHNLTWPLIIKVLSCHVFGALTHDLV